jgi:two-component system, OmpR family, phosphate regulon response regulator PhoB
MTKTVLVAEDDSDILGLVRAVLEDAGYTVVSAVGKATLTAIAEKRPDVLLLDYQMPGMDGVIIAQTVRAEETTRHIPIIAMTAAGRAPLVCSQMDADGCLGKPFDIDHLVNVVDGMVHSTH